MRSPRQLVSTALFLAGLVASSVTPVSAQTLNYGVSCTASASIVGETPNSLGTYDVTIRHTISCNQAVEQIIARGTDYKEGFQSSSSRSGSRTCTNTNYCDLFIDVPAQNCPNGWYVLRTSGDIGKPGNNRYYGSLTEVRQRLFWYSPICS